MNPKSSFQLLNKDRLILEFAETEEDGIFKVVREGAGFTGSGLSRPIGFGSINEWLRGRLYVFNRTKLSKYFGSISEVIAKTHCCSLNDTYWVKAESDGAKWADVSPYGNKLVELCDFPFLLASNSPSFSVNGGFPKCWVDGADGGKYLLKAGSVKNVTREPYSEVYAYQLAACLGLDCVEYRLDDYKGTLVSSCKCFCDEEVGFVSYGDFYDLPWISYGQALETISDEYRDKLVDMLFLDCMTLNIDRHAGNFGFLVENDTGEVVGLAPIFDNNLGCVPYIDTEGELERTRENLLSAEEKSFDELFALINCDRVGHYMKLLRDFSFTDLDGRGGLLDEMLHKNLRRFS